MFQLEVKRLLVEHCFPPSGGWDVTVDIDSMERGERGQHQVEKRAIAAENEAWLKANGVHIVAHQLFGRADLVASKEGVGTFVVEVEADSSKQREQALYSALGQIVMSMGNPAPTIQYGLALPDAPEWERQVRKVPGRVLELLKLNVWLVSPKGVRRYGAQPAPAEDDPKAQSPRKPRAAPL